ncbi:hypothetical protein SSX86_021713 [Deinandra increscens subsp. villosa]|uniref:Late embryogenesis abundant protein LEA-2 subgroup domain-containing protein n=1 Tax=Deinandra increscens subsp. villosa TaxID=3103831 RepID=A0AAP0CTQ0_9ASTR
MSTGEDGGDDNKVPKIFEIIFYIIAISIILIFVISILVIAYVLIIFIPTTYLFPPTPSPHFTLHGAKLHAFNLTTTTLTSTFQITISTRNTYMGYAFHFDKLEVYASYRKQQITLPTTIPPSYLGSPEFTIWSPFLNGTDVLLSPDLAMFLGQDETAGMMLIDVEVIGELSLKQQFDITHRTKLKVKCPGYVMFGNKNGSEVVVDWAAFEKPFVDGCRVEVSKLKKPVKKKVVNDEDSSLEQNSNIEDCCMKRKGRKFAPI